MELSIIIPVYNTEKSLLEECIRSIVNSTLEPGSYEILLIDDGSTLDYTDLIDAYSLRHIKTENRGIFSARMLGIDNALGDYIAFVDSDDSVSFNYHRPMLEAAKCGADIVYNDWAFHTKRARYYLRYDSTISGDITATEGDIIDRFLLSEGREHSYSVLWNKVFSAELLRRVREHLATLDTPEGYNYSEDTLINFLAHKWAKNMENIHTGYYFYRTHAAQTVSVTSRERLVSHIENMSFTLREMERNVDISNDKAHSRIRAWAALMSRTHYSYAKAGGYTDLYEKIKAAYGVDELSLSTFADGAVYHNTVLLPENIADIDAALLRLWRTEGRSLVAPTKDKYTSRALQSMIDCGKEIGVAKNGEVLPKPRIRLASRILHNPVLYKLGMLLFPKGSPLRSILKRGL